MTHLCACVNQLRPVEPLEGWLRTKRLQFLQQRADQFHILRRVPAAGHHDLSFLVTVQHMQMFDKAQLIRFICQCVEEMSSATDLKRLTLSRGRSAGSALIRDLPK